MAAKETAGRPKRWPRRPQVEVLGAFRTPNSLTKHIYGEFSPKHRIFVRLVFRQRFSFISLMICCFHGKPCNLATIAGASVFVG